MVSLGVCGGGGGGGGGGGETAMDAMEKEPVAR